MDENQTNPSNNDQNLHDQALPQPPKPENLQSDIDEPEILPNDQTGNVTQVNHIENNEQPTIIERLADFLKENIVLLIPVILLIYAMTIPTTEAGVNSVGQVYFLAGVIITFYFAITKTRKTKDELYKTEGTTVRGLILSNLALIAVFLLLILGFASVLSVVIIPIFLLGLGAASKSTKKISNIHPAIKVIAVIVSFLVTFASYGILILIGMFMISLRACELSSSKCL